MVEAVNAIELKNITKRFGEKVIANDSVNLTVRKGEILSLLGENGSGKTTLMNMLSGIYFPDEGQIFVNGREVNIKTPQDAVENGIGYLSEDRKQYGLCLGLSVSDNIALPNLDRETGAVVNDEKLRQIAHEYVKQISIKTPTVDTPVRSLSGGNQQKVVIAKWLLKNCDILIFDEPTRGIDVGAKSEIYEYSNMLAAQGMAILLISSDLPEVMGMSDRIMVVSKGRITGTYTKEEIDVGAVTQNNLLSSALQEV